MQQTAGEVTFKNAAGGMFLEGIAAIILAIIGLAGILPHTLAGIAGVVMGATLLTEGGAVTSGYRLWASRVGNEGETPSWSEGLSAEFLGGLAGIVLGILALLGLSSEALLAVALIVFGTTFLLSHTALAPLGWMSGFQTPATTAENAPLTPVTSSSGQMLVGLAALVLGILALVGLTAWTLVLVGMLCLGAATLFNAIALRNRLLAMSHSSAVSQ